jgi:hypothetical protein
MDPPEKPTLEYATPAPVAISFYEKGLSNGRMAFLLLLVGYPFLVLPFIGLPFLIASLWLAILAFIRTQRESIFAWIVLVAFMVLALFIFAALTYGLLTHSL